MFGAPNEAHVQRLIGDRPVYTRTTDRKGRALFAAKSIPKGTVIFEEFPLVAMQTLPNRRHCAVCSHCLRFVGSLEAQLELLAQRQTLQSFCNEKVTWQLPDSSSESDQYRVARCAWGCGEIYCSEACRAEAEPVHQLLCVALVPDESSPLYQYKIFAMNTNEIFLLCAAVCAKIIVRQRQCGCWREAIKPFHHFTAGLWWEIVVPDNPYDTERLPEVLREACANAASLLGAALGHRLPAGGGTSTSSHSQSNSCQHCSTDCSALAQQIFTTEFFGMLVGLFERNQHGIRMVSPLQEYFKELAGSGATEEHRAVLEPLLNDIEDAINAEADSEDNGSCCNAGSDGECE
eukprot:EG_transcript_15745